MSYTPKSRFTEKDTPAETARKINDELLRISRAQKGKGSGGSGVSASSSGPGGGSSIAVTTPSWARFFMIMGG